MLFIVFAVVLLAVCAFALLKGEGPERTGASALLLAWLATTNIYRLGSELTPWAVFAIDLALLLVLSVLVFRTNRQWPIWAAAFHLFSMLSHVSVLLNLTEIARGYVQALSIASLGVVGSLAVGTFWVWQEREALKPLE